MKTQPMTTPEPVESISGQIAGINLSSFLQMIEIEQKTCTIKIFTRKDLGKIFFLNGTLIDASTNSLNHLEAVFEILSWKNIVIEIEKNETVRQDLISLPLMHILMQSAQLSDENHPPDDDDRQVEDIRQPVKTIPLKILGKKDFCLEIGVRLLVDFDALSITFKSSLVGIEHGRYLLIKAPSPFGRVDHDLVEVDAMTIKSLYKGTIYAFRSRLLGMVSEPSKLMFIEYPKIIEHHELRSYKRFRCSIVTQAEIDRVEREGVIENISRGGCLCIIEVSSEHMKKLDPILNSPISFRCRFPGSKKEAIVSGEIKNARKTEEGTAVGVEFLFQEDLKGAKQSVENYIRVIESSGETA